MSTTKETHSALRGEKRYVTTRQAPKHEVVYRFISYAR